MSPWGAYLSELLTARGWSIRAFATRVGCDQSFLSKAMRRAPTGRRRVPALPPLGRLEAWIEMLQLDDEQRARFLFLAQLEHAPEELARRVRETESAYAASRLRTEQVEDENRRLKRELNRLRRHMEGTSG
ncbi:MAG: helix-turn-helix domain-containing protein [Planctomycetota bacterium]